MPEPKGLSDATGPGANPAEASPSGQPAPTDLAFPAEADIRLAQD